MSTSDKGRPLKPLILAEEGGTGYEIVIAAKACEAERYAAK